MDIGFAAGPARFGGVVVLRKNEVFTPGAGVQCEGQTGVACGKLSMGLSCVVQERSYHCDITTRLMPNVVYILNEKVQKACKQLGTNQSTWNPTWK